MIKIVVGGQIGKSELVLQIKELGGEEVSVSEMGDIEAAMAVKNGTADFYVGACHTGGGGALAMAIALIGNDQCSTLSMPGNIRSDDEIRREIASGKRALGFTFQHAQSILPIVIESILNQNKG